MPAYISYDMAEIEAFFNIDFQFEDFLYLVLLFTFHSTTDAQCTYRSPKVDMRHPAKSNEKFDNVRHYLRIYFNVYRFGL